MELMFHAEYESYHFLSIYYDIHTLNPMTEYKLSAEVWKWNVIAFTGHKKNKEKKNGARMFYQSSYLTFIYAVSTVRKNIYSKFL